MSSIFFNFPNAGSFTKFVINTARGEIIREAELVKALTPFLRDTQVNFHIRSFYFERQRKEGRESEAWALGDLNVGIITQYGWDLWNTLYAEANYSMELSENLAVSMSGQYTDQRSVGGNLTAEIP